MKKSLLILALALVLSSSCTSFISKMHHQIDEYDNSKNASPREYDAFAQFRGDSNRSKNLSHSTQHAQILRRQVSKSMPNTMNTPKLNPSVRRQYLSESAVKKRFQENDLNDNTSGGSLWAGSGNENYLFTKNKWKKMGDIVLLSVMNKLKNEITQELARAFPAPVPRAKKPDGEVAPPPVATDGDTANKEDLVEGQNQIHDRISSVIVEEISQDHLLVRGRKLLLYKNRKRLVEVQALVTRRDISDEDTIDSDRVLESSIVVMR